MTPYWPETVPDCPERYRATGGPVDVRVAFQPERGPEITRPGTTARWEEWSLPMAPFTLAQFNTFEAWFDSDLARGSKAFAWRHPVTGVIGLWRFKSGPRPYEVAQTAKGYVLVSFTLVKQPGTPWWASYIPVGKTSVPLLVIDFQNGRYGRNGDREAITAVTTFTRASAGSFLGANGLIQTVGNNQARIDANGLILGAARTNLSFRSAEFDNATWTKAQTTVTANAAVAPDGLTAAEKLIPTAVAADHVTSQTFAGITTGQQYTYSVFFKADGYGWARVSLGTSFGSNWAFVNLATGALGATSGQTSITATSFGNGWWRLSGTVTATATGNGLIAIYALNADSFTTFAGNGTSGILAWGAQVELGADASDYIATTTAAATRAVESINITNAVPACDLRIVNRAGVVTDTLATSITAGSWPGALAAGARSIVAFPVGVLGP